MIDKNIIDIRCERFGDPPMPQSSSILGLSRGLLRLAVGLNLVLGAMMLALLVASLVAEADMLASMGGAPGTHAMLIQGLRGLMILGLICVPLIHVILARLLAIVETVRCGDPFVADNGARLTTIAWAALALQLIHLVGIAIALSASSSEDRISWNFSLTGWLAVLLLFLLARVFDQGARMRDELEGTV
jgi:hypothetical protein